MLVAHPDKPIQSTGRKAWLFAAWNWSTIASLKPRYLPRWSLISERTPLRRTDRY